MNPEPKNKIEVFYDGKLICVVDSDSPSLTDIVNKVILIETNVADKIECTSTIENFDIDGFKEVLVGAIQSIRKQLKSDVDDFTKIMDTIEVDQDVKQFYESLSKSIKTM
jgi:hypothetical protein